MAEVEVIKASIDQTHIENLSGRSRKKRVWCDRGKNK